MGVTKHKSFYFILWNLKVGTKKDRVRPSIRSTPSEVSSEIAPKIKINSCWLCDTRTHAQGTTTNLCAAAADAAEPRGQCCTRCTNKGPASQRKDASAGREAGGSPAGSERVPQPTSSFRRSRGTSHAADALGWSACTAGLPSGVYLVRASPASRRSARRTRRMRFYGVNESPVGGFKAELERI